MTHSSLNPWGEQRYPRCRCLAECAQGRFGTMGQEGFRLAFPPPLQGFRKASWHLIAALIKESLGPLKQENVPLRRASERVTEWRFPREVDGRQQWRGGRKCCTILGWRLDFQDPRQELSPGIVALLSICAWRFKNPGRGRKWQRLGGTLGVKSWAVRMPCYFRRKKREWSCLRVWKRGCFIQEAVLAFSWQNINMINDWCLPSPCPPMSEMDPSWRGKKKGHSEQRTVLQQVSTRGPNSLLQSFDWEKTLFHACSGIQDSSSSSRPAKRTRSWPAPVGNMRSM